MSPRASNALQGLRAAPVEIRQMIFRLCLDYEGETPNLLKALRHDSGLHMEAVLIYNKINAKLTLNLANNWSVAGAEQSKLKCVRILQIDINQELGARIPDLPSPTFNDAYPNIDKVENTLRGLEGLCISAVETIIREVPNPSLEVWDDEQWDHVDDLLIRIPWLIYQACVTIRRVTYVTYQAPSRVNSIQNSMGEDTGQSGRLLDDLPTGKKVLQWDITPAIINYVTNEGSPA